MTSLNEMSHHETTTTTNQQEQQISSAAPSSIDELFSRLIGQSSSPAPQENSKLTTSVPEPINQDVINVMSLLEGVKTMEKVEIDPSYKNSSSSSSELELESMTR